MEELRKAARGGRRKEKDREDNEEKEWKVEAFVCALVFVQVERYSVTVWRFAGGSEVRDGNLKLE